MLDEIYVSSVKPVGEEKELEQLFHDEQFNTVPDWKLKSTEFPINKEGAVVSGVLPAKGSLSEIDVTFTRG